MFEAILYVGLAIVGISLLRAVLSGPSVWIHDEFGNYREITDVRGA